MYTFLSPSLYGYKAPWCLCAIQSTSQGIYWTNERENKQITKTDPFRSLFFQ